MEMPPRNNNDREPDVPEPEKLAPGEIDLTGATDQDVQLYSYIYDALHDAEHDGRLPDWGARAVARALANDLVDSVSALHQYAVTGRMDRSRVAAELATIYGHISFGDTAGQLVNRLAAYVLDQPDPDGTTDENAPRPSIEHVHEGIRRHGDAFKAFLRLADVGIDFPDIVKSFEDIYIGSFDTLEALVEQLTDLGQWREAIDTVTEQWGIGDFVSFDYRKLYRVALETWSIVGLDGKLHVFTK